jgi:hypothetical protein
LLKQVCTSEEGMTEQESNGSRPAPVAARNNPAGERDAELDAAIEGTFPASDPVASFDFR